MSQLVVTVRKSENIEKIIDTCIEYNVYNYRINLARSTMEKNEDVIKIINNKVENPMLFLDIPGNKNRICKLLTESMKVNKNQILTMYSNSENGNISLENYNGFYDSTKIGDVIIFGDNDVSAKVVSINSKRADIEILSGNKIKSHTGYINVTNYNPMNDILDLEIEMITKFDSENIVWGISFSDTVERIEKCKKYIKKGKIVAKIETSSGIENIDDITNHVDGIMLARGDLSIFYREDIINELLFNKLSENAKNKSKDYLVATNIFKKLATYGKTCREEQRIFQLFNKKADYIIANETSYSTFWKDIIKFYINNRNIE